MYQFLETIRINDGSVLNLNYHQSRMDKTLELNFSEYSVGDLISIISIPAEFAKGIVKCRVEYDNHNYAVTFESYKPRQINSLKVLTDDSIDYRFKFSDRRNLVRLMEKRDNCDDILIVKNNMITDTSFSNLIFFDDKVWYTPSNPLLNGTTRARLLSEGRISEKEIFLDDLPKYSHFKLINSMLNDDFSDRLPLSAIVV